MLLDFAFVSKVVSISANWCQRRLEPITSETITQYGSTVNIGTAIPIENHIKGFCSFSLSIDFILISR